MKTKRALLFTTALLMLLGAAPVLAQAEFDCDGFALSDDDFIRDGRLQGLTTVEESYSPDEVRDQMRHLATMLSNARADIQMARDAIRFNDCEQASCAVDRARMTLKYANNFIYWQGHRIARVKDRQWWIFFRRNDYENLRAELYGVEGTTYRIEDDGSIRQRVRVMRGGRWIWVWRVVELREVEEVEGLRTRLLVVHRALRDIAAVVDAECGTDHTSKIEDVSPEPTEEEIEETGPNDENGKPPVQELPPSEDDEPDLPPELLECARHLGITNAELNRYLEALKAVMPEADAKRCMELLCEARTKEEFCELVAECAYNWAGLDLPADIRRQIREAEDCTQKVSEEVIPDVPPPSPPPPLRPELLECARHLGITNAELNRYLEALKAVMPEADAVQCMELLCTARSKEEFCELVAECAYNWAGLDLPADIRRQIREAEDCTEVVEPPPPPPDLDCLRKHGLSQADYNRYLSLLTEIMGADAAGRCMASACAEPNRDAFCRRLFECALTSVRLPAEMKSQFQREFERLARDVGSCKAAEKTLRIVPPLPPHAPPVPPHDPPDPPKPREINQWLDCAERIGMSKSAMWDYIWGLMDALPQSWKECMNLICEARSEEDFCRLIRDCYLGKYGVSDRVREVARGQDNPCRRAKEELEGIRLKREKRWTREQIRPELEKWVIGTKNPPNGRSPQPPPDENGEIPENGSEIENPDIPENVESNRRVEPGSIYEFWYFRGTLYIAAERLATWDPNRRDEMMQRVSQDDREFAPKPWEELLDEGLVEEDTVVWRLRVTLSEPVSENGRTRVSANLEALDAEVQRSRVGRLSDLTIQHWKVVELLADGGEREVISSRSDRTEFTHTFDRAGSYQIRVEGRTAWENRFIIPSGTIRIAAGDR